MRVAIAGAAAAAVLGGALAVAPLTISNQSRTSTGAGTCSAGQQCDKLASVLMPQTGKPAAAGSNGVPSALEPPEPVSPAVAPKPPAEPAAYTPPNPSPAGPGLLPGANNTVPPASSPANALPPGYDPNDAALPGIGQVPGVGVPGLPDLYGYAGGVAGLAGVPYGVNAAAAVVNGVLGVGNTVASVVSTSALAVTYVVLAYNALQSSGILPAAQGTISSLGSMLLPSAAAALPAAALPCRHW